MMKPLIVFLRTHALLGSVFVVGIVAGVLALAGYAVASQWIVTIFSVAIAGKLAIGMVQTLRSGQFGIDILAIIAILSTAALGQYWATLIIVAMLVGGEELEEYAGRRATRELTALLQRAPTIAHVRRDDQVEDVPVNEVRVGDILIVRPGEVVPVDAEVQDGQGSVDESSLTGESLPVEKQPGSELLSGSVNGESVLTVRALRTAEKSQYAQIVRLVQEAADSKAPFVRLADRYAVPFTFGALTIAGIAWAVSGDPVRFAEVLVVATPCPLLIAAPVALISGMSRSAKHGIIVKSGAVLEQLARIKTAVFDKTGTVTTGVLIVSDVRPAAGVAPEELLYLAASAERQSTHILAKAVQTAAEKKGLLLEEPRSVQEVAGQGLQARIGKTTIVVGRASFLKQHGISVSDSDVEYTTLYVGRGKKYLGSISFEDAPRRNARRTLRALRDRGVRHFALLTGDASGTARRVGVELGIEDIHAECLPGDKLRLIQTYTDRPVMMVGDGVNDAPVLAAADVGVAMGARGSTAASESADVVIMLDDISRVDMSVAIAQRTLRIALQSVWIGIIISVLLMLIASTGRIPAILGAGLQELVDVLVIFNALRAHGGR